MNFNKFLNISKYFKKFPAFLILAVLVLGMVPTQMASAADYKQLDIVFSSNPVAFGTELVVKVVAKDGVTLPGNQTIAILFSVTPSSPPNAQTKILDGAAGANILSGQRESQTGKFMVDEAHGFARPQTDAGDKYIIRALASGLPAETSVSGQAELTVKPGVITFTPNQIVFAMSTDGSVYRAVAGQDAKIEVNVDLAPNSAKLRFDGTEKFRKAGSIFDVVIGGLYTAAGPAARTEFCGATTCTFFDYESEHATIAPRQGGAVLPYKKTLNIKTGVYAKVDSINLNAGQTADIQVIPVIDIQGSADVPFATNGVKIRLEVYDSQASLLAAAQKAGDTDGNPNVSGAPATGTTSSQDQGGRSSLGAAATDTAGGVLLFTINIILGIIIGILRWVVWAIGTLIFVPLLETTLKIDAANMSSFITVGWQYVRDVVNMFFILGLIVIGFGTILRIESYNYKKLLVNLIMMAFLVNFSLVIGRIIIQMADVVQFSFLPVGDVGKDSTGQGISGVRYLFQSLSTVHLESITDGIRAFSITTSGALQTTFTLIFQFIFELGVIITFGALSVFMLIRTVMLWILLIISPVAYALAIIPATAQYAKKWWSSFIKYVLFAPIIAFFMRLTLELYQNGLKIFPAGSLPGVTANTDLIGYLNNTRNGVGAGVTFDNALVLIMIYVVILVFLWAGMLVTKEMGIYGAAAITGLAEKGIKAPFALGGKGLKALGGLGLQAYSRYMGQKAFNETDREVNAKYKKFGLQNKLKGLRDKEADRPQRLKDAKSRQKLAREKLEQAKKLAKKASLEEREAANSFLLEASGELSSADNEVKAIGSEQAEIGAVEAGVYEAEHEEHTAERRKKMFSIAQFLNPMAVKKGWEERSHEKKQRAYLPASGAVHDMLNRYLPTEWGVFHGRGWTAGRDTEHGFMGRFQVLKAEEKELEGLRINRMYASYMKHNADKNGEAEDIFGASSIVARQRNADDFHNLEGREYTPFQDLEYNSKNAWQRLSPAERNIMTSQIQEQLEAKGYFRELGYYNERLQNVSNDLEYMRDPEKFKTEKTNIVAKLKDLNVPQFTQMANHFDRDVSSLDDVYKDPELYETVVSLNMVEAYQSKARRGSAIGWVKGSFEPASVRVQDPNKGWTRYTKLGLMKLRAELPQAVQSWIGRLHEGEGRATIFGGAMVDKNTGLTRIPKETDGEYYEAWKQAIETRPDIAASVWAFYNAPEKVRNAYDAVVEKKAKMDAKYGLVKLEDGKVPTDANGIPRTYDFGK